LLIQSILLFSEPEISISTSTIGKNLLTGKDINAIKSEFTEYITNPVLDTTLNALTLQLRSATKNGNYFKSKGYLTLFDLSSKSLKWIISNNYATDILQQNHEIITRSNSYAGQNTRININDGKDMWRTNMIIYASMPNLNIALCYNYNYVTGVYSNTLKCVDLNDGHFLWKRKVENSSHWNGYINLNDTAIIVKSSGLHLINLKTGKGWDYEMKTGVNDYSKMIGLNVLGATLGILTGTYVIAGGHDMVSNLVSNLASDSLCYYFASKDCLLCISKNGDLQWKVELPKETSHSNIIIDSTNVYLLNDGEALYNGRSFTYGKPYYAAFDKKNGFQKYMEIFEWKKNPQLDFRMTKDSIDMVFKDQAKRFSIQNGDCKTIIFDTLKYGYLKYPVFGEKKFLKKDTTFECLNENDPKAFYLMSSKNEIVKLDENLKLENYYSPENLYTLIIRTKEYKFLKIDDKTVIINNKKQAVAEINLSENMFVFRNKLYGIDKQSIYEIDLETELSN
jgi:hypothetical protein